MGPSSHQSDVPRLAYADPELIESIPLIVLCLNAEQRVVYANECAARALKMPRDALQNDLYLEVHPDESRILREEFAQMVAIGDPVEIGPRSAEFRVRRADGEWRWLRALASAYHDANGAFRVVTMSEDITELRAIQRVHATEDDSAATFTIDLGPEPPVVAGVDLEFERLSGYVSEELTGTPVPDLFSRLYEPGRTELLHLLNNVRLGHEGGMNVYWQSSTGIAMRAKIRIIPLVDDTHSHRRAVGVVTASRPIADESSAAHARISDRLLALGRFAMGLSHELNNPLGAILLSTERAMRLSRDDLVGECLAESIREVRRCSSIVQSLHRFGRGGKSTLSLCDVNQIVRRAIDAQREFDLRPRVKATLKSDLPMLRIDPVGIELAMVNLIRNACEASQSDSVVDVSTELSRGGVEIRVSDRGRGIRREDRRFILEPFYSTRAEEGRSGIGLSVVHGIVTSHRGIVEFGDREGGGTVVTVWLPHETGN